MKTIWKYTLEMKESQELVMPSRARILGVQLQQGQPVMWALVDPLNDKKVVVIQIVGTGEDAGSVEDAQHIGSVQIREYVWHFFTHG